MGDQLAELAPRPPRAALGRRPAACRTSATAPTARCGRCCEAARAAAAARARPRRPALGRRRVAGAVAHLLRRPPRRGAAARARVPRRRRCRAAARGALADRRARRRWSRASRSAPLSRGGGRRAARRRRARRRARGALRAERRQPVLPRAARARARRGAARRRGEPATRPACRPRVAARARPGDRARCPSGARLLAQGAAVAGDPVDLDLAAAAAGLDEAAALAALDELLAGALLRRRPTSRAATASATRSSAARSTTPPAEGWRLAAHARAARGAGRARRLARRARAPPRALRAARRRRRARACSSRPAARPPPRAPATAAGWFGAALRLLPETPETAVPAARAARRRSPRRSPPPASSSARWTRSTRRWTWSARELAPVRARLVAGCAMCENLLGRHAAAHARLLARARRARRHAARRPPPTSQVELAADALYDSDFAAMRAWAQRGRDDRARRSARRRWRPSPPRWCASPSSAWARPRAAAGAAGRAPPRGSTRCDDDALAGRLDAAYYLGFAEFFCERYDDAIRHLRRGIAVSRASGQGQFVMPMTIGLAHALEVRGRLRRGGRARPTRPSRPRGWPGNRQMLVLRADRRRAG